MDGITESPREYMLAMDTSTRSLSVALLRGDECIAEDGLEAARNHSMYLVPVIHRLLASQNLTVSDLQLLAVGVGPGSYTGVRIGVTVAKTMAWSLQLPLIGVSSLSAYAHAARVQRNDEAHSNPSTSRGLQLYMPLLDARRSQVYTGLYGDRDGLWECLEADRIVPIADWFSQVAERSLGPVVLLGDTAPFSEAIQSFSARVPVEIQDLQLSAYHVGLLARARWLRGESDELHELAPNYAQLAEAEAKLLAAQALEG